MLSIWCAPVISVLSNIGVKFTAILLWETSMCLVCWVRHAAQLSLKYREMHLFSLKRPMKTLKSLKSWTVSRILQLKKPDRQSDQCTLAYSRIEQIFLLTIK